VSNVLNEEKKKQSSRSANLAGRSVELRRPPASAGRPQPDILKAAGIPCAQPGGWGGGRPPSKPANEVTTDPEAAKPANGMR
jgi:hypothetical protein